MGRFMMLYKGDATDPGDMSEDERNAVMVKWAEWMQGVGPALADVGAPLGPGTSLIDDGSTGAPVSLSGYSIVEADDLAAATRLADGHPFLSEGKGNFSIEVYEMMPVPM